MNGRENNQNSQNNQGRNSGEGHAYRKKCANILVMLGVVLASSFLVACNADDPSLTPTAQTILLPSSTPTELPPLVMSTPVLEATFTPTRNPEITPATISPEEAGIALTQIADSSGEPVRYEVRSTPLPRNSLMDESDANVDSEIQEAGENQIVAAVDAPAEDAQPNAIVPEASAGLRMRSLPSTNAPIIQNLDARLELIVYSRTPDNEWVAIQTPSKLRGWVNTTFLEISVNLNNIPAVEVDVSDLPTLTPTVAGEQIAGGNAVEVASAENVVAASGSGIVVAEGSGLRLREQPSRNAAILGTLDEQSPVSILGKSQDGSWLQVRTDSGEGWVFASYVQTGVEIANLNVPEAAYLPTPAFFEPPTTDSARGAISGVTSNSAAIYLQGQRLGNRSDVFSKVGDSITATGHFLYPFGWGNYELHSYSYFQPVINYFGRTQARESVSFSNGSYAAKPYWTSSTVLDPSSADGACNPGEMPLVCEYRVVRPSISLVMIGTNDIGQNSAGQFQANLQRIVEISIDMGVIPILSTIPPKVGWESDVAVFNSIIISTAQGYDVPLWDYYTAMLPLPNNGLDGDGVHPSHLGAEYENYPPSATFTDSNLQNGFTLRNLMALQVLDAVWRQVIAPNEGSVSAVSGASNVTAIDPSLLNAPVVNEAPVEVNSGSSVGDFLQQCPGAPPSRLTIGARGRVTPGPANNFRANPSNSAGLLGTIPGGAGFNVLEGPVCADSMAYWKVDYNGTVGWTAEGKGNTYWLEPS